MLQSTQKRNKDEGKEETEGSSLELNFYRREGQTFAESIPALSFY